MHPEQAVRQSLDLLAAELELHEVSLDSHTSLVVAGLDDSRVIDALGLYIVALLAGMVRTTLRLTSALLNQTPEGQAELAANVEARLSPGTASPRTQAEFNEDVRDPWIAECIGHALLAVRGRGASPCLRGSVAAVMVPHVKPSEQGLDLFAIFDDMGLPAMALGEAKATLHNGGGRLSEAAAFFRKVADGDRDLDILMRVTILTESLSEELQEGLSALFWHQRACYLPVIAYGNSISVSRRRRALRDIPRPPEDKRVVFCRPENYARFFDAVATAMRDAVTTVIP